MNSVNSTDLRQKTLDVYLEKMLIKNDSINLTRVTDWDQAKLLHIEDSLAVLEEFEKAPEGMFGDLGSGCGFPGVALSIMTGREVVLIDSVKKKMRAVDEIIEDIGLSSQIITNANRIEDIAKDNPEEFSVLTARALSSLSSLLELASPLLKLNGHLIALKSHVDEEEIENAKSIEKLTGMKLISKREFYLSDKETFRSVYVFEKVNKPSIKLPRRVGLAQKQPLK